MLIKMLSQVGGYNVLHGFTEYTGERERPVICRVCFIAFLKKRTYLGFLPISWYYSIIERSLKDQSYNGCNFLAQLL